ncbi:MAG: CRISPR-associated endonuclease Cas2 [Acidithiobacillus sp.]
MQAPSLVLVAYDSHESRIRAQLRARLKETSIGHQRSVYEHFMPLSECRQLLERISPLIDAQDNLWAWSVDPRSAVRTWGIGRKPTLEKFVMFA